MEKRGIFFYWTCQFSKCLLIFSCQTFRAEKHLKPVVRTSWSTEILRRTFQTKGNSLLVLQLLTKGRPAVYSVTMDLYMKHSFTQNPSDKEMECVKINTCLITFNEISWMKNYSRFFLLPLT